MYEVMARRYRPAHFDDVVGQEHIAATLKNAITRDRVAHAYIFTGGHGCGKTTMARILARALVCKNGPTPDPCGVCPICVDVAAGRDADVLEIDGASNNGIEQIRLLREQAAYVPTRARFKIYIIDEVHMLSDGAFNALLKTLEEPPRHVKFILATTDPHKVPDTILSRCQRFDFRLVPQARLAVFFRSLAEQEKAAISDDALEAVAAFAEGSVRDGLVLLDQLLSFADGEVTREDVEAVRGVASTENVAGIFTRIAGGDVKGALAIVDEVASRGTNVGDFLDQLIAFGRDLMLLAAGGTEEGIAAYGPARAELFTLAKATSLESALLYLDALAAARTRVRSRALTNPLVALEMAVARLAGLGGVTPVSQVLAQLGQLPAASIPTPAQTQTPQTQTTAAPVVPAAPAAAPAPVPPVPPVRKDPEPVPERIPEQSPPERPAHSLTRDEAEALWSKLLDSAAERHPSDLRLMLRITVDDVAGDEIILTGSPTRIEPWNDSIRQKRLTDMATEALGRPVRFVFKERAPKRDAARAADDAQTEFNLTRHPMVDKVRSLFDGVIVACEAARQETESDPDRREEDGEE
ncbi:MAG: DNA polymerase III subunit gamma/tau [Planctomycetota bacterium]|jgi:DNA polymerase-3 subunit gamma/tau|nr:DNA polymerase III subunit gamma/tau [Planctomycetota bacterium]